MAGGVATAQAGAEEAGTVVTEEIHPEDQLEAKATTEEQEAAVATVVDTPPLGGPMSPDMGTSLQSSPAGSTGNLERLLTGVRSRRRVRGRISSHRNETVASLKNC